MSIERSLTFFIDYDLYSLLFLLVALFFIEGQSLKRTFKILAFSLPVSILSAVIFFYSFVYFFDYVKINTWGKLESHLAIFCTSIVLALVTRKYLKLKLFSVPFIAFLPPCYLGLAFNYLTPKEKPQTELEFNHMNVNSSLKHIPDFIAKYKTACGHLPKTIRQLIEPDKKCPKWTDFDQLSYRDGDGIRDPWRRDYIYQVKNKTSYRLGTFGADGLEGGTDANADLFTEANAEEKNP